MRDDRHHDAPGSRAAKSTRRRINVALIGFLLIAGYFLVTEHRAHAIQYLPLLLLLLCPVLHLLHHHDGSKPGKEGQRSPEDSKEHGHA